LLVALTQGTKELKLNAARRTDFIHGPVRETTDDLIKQGVAVQTHYAASGAVNATLVLLVLSVVLFALPHGSTLRVEVASGYVLVGLYLISPLAALSRMWPLFRSAELALRSLDRLGMGLSGTRDEVPATAGVRPAAASIELASVTFRHDGERKFTLGPISLRVVPGQVLFIVGGNGSGKTTLGRLLTGLYTPDAGELLWDGQTVDAHNIDLYRQLWSAVFSDAYMFDGLHGIDLEQIESQAPALIERLGLHGVVQLKHEAFSSLELSQGQRKRACLLIALLENREYCLFDEWAADQDPEWKRIFYRELLPELRARGKAVVVITHDDRYFDAADRVVVLHDGQVDP
jgi:putative ATP-binding cassette transporter